MHGVKFVIKLDVGFLLDYNKQYADVAELVDALASGASASNGVKVQVLSSAPGHGKLRNCRLKWRLFHLSFHSVSASFILE